MGEVTVLLLLGLIFLGPKTLPELGRGLREQAWTLRGETRVASRPSWSRSDWVVVIVALLLGSLALALAIVGG